VFHAADCEKAKGEYHGWGEDRIGSFQRRLIGLITREDYAMLGYAVTIPVASHATLRARIRRFIRFDKGSPINGPLDDPWVLTLQFLVVSVCEDPQTIALPPEEQIGFVFDRHHLSAHESAIYSATTRIKKYKDRVPFPSESDPEIPIRRDVLAKWLQQAEQRAGLKKLDGSLWHADRRAWATSRKELPTADVAAAGGWSDVATLPRCYQQPDEATMLSVMSHPRKILDRTSGRN
jgi:hypothetical protein